MTKKQVIRMVAFILAACGVLYLLCDLFERDNMSNFDQRATSFRAMSEDSLDAVIIGTSGIDRYWIAPKAYEEYGMTVYSLSSDAMPAWLYVNRLKEIYTYQDPELIIVDLRAFTQGNTDATVTEARARRVLDAKVYLSPDFLDGAFKTMEVLNRVDPESSYFQGSLLLPLIKYHTMWDEEEYYISEHLGNKKHEYGGFWMSTINSVGVEAQTPRRYKTSLRSALDPISVDALYEFLVYVKENDIQVLFLDTPQYKSRRENGRSNSVYRVLDAWGMDYINYCLTDKKGNFLNDCGLDPAVDFYKSGHVNYYGAEKFTASFAKYLDENYDFPDHREDETVKEEWDGLYDKIKETIVDFEERKKLRQEQAALKEQNGQYEEDAYDQYEQEEEALD